MEGRDGERKLREEREKMERRYVDRKLRDRDVGG
jgi:hypothetical protein